MIERNLKSLLRQDLRRIVVSVSASLPELKDYVLGRGRCLVEEAKGTLEIIEEEKARGNIGCAAELRSRSDTILLLFADNLTTLDLRQLLNAHQRGEASLTLATHFETVRLPFGVIDAMDGRIVAYREKPSRSELICSGIYVLGDRALAAIPRDQAMDASDLVEELLKRGEIVNEFRHRALWVDVNDADALARAEALTVEPRWSFED